MKQSQQNRYRIIIGLCLASVLGLTACASKPTAESIAKGKKLAYTRCTTCHSSENFEHHRYSRAEWQSIIQRMMKHGAQYTPEEQSLVADFLSAKYGK